MFHVNLSITRIAKAVLLVFRGDANYYILLVRNCTKKLKYRAGTHLSAYFAINALLEKIIQSVVNCQINHPYYL